MIERVTGETYDGFICRREFTVIHFDAEWDVGGREITRAQLLAAASSADTRQSVNFGEVDVDADLLLARRLPVGNVPTVAYYRHGELVAALIGAGQNISARLTRVIKVSQSVTKTAPIYRIPMRQMIIRHHP